MALDSCQNFSNIYPVPILTFMRTNAMLSRAQTFFHYLLKILITTLALGLSQYHKKKRDLSGIQTGVRGYKNNFLISQQKHMLWILKRLIRARKHMFKLIGNNNIFS